MNAKKLRTKVLTYEEYLKHPDYLDFDCYVVRFHFVNEDGLQRRKEVSYFARGKGKHDLVQKRWELDFAGIEKELISVVYQ